MNPGGPAEEAGKAAGVFMDVMRTQPLSLALVVMNIALLALFWYFAKTSSDTRHREFEANANMQREINQLLARCIVPPSNP